MLMAFTQAAFFYLLIQSSFACKMQLPDFLIWTAPWMFAKSDSPAQVKLSAVGFLNYYNNFYMAYFLMKFIYLNGLIVVDLLIILRYPMKKLEFQNFLRYSIFNWASITLATSVAQDYNYEEGRYRHGFVTTLQWIFICFIVIVVIMTILIVIMILNLGLATDSKNKILWRHFFYQMTFNVCNFYVLYGVINFYNQTDTRDYNDQLWYVKLMRGLFYSQGFLLPIVRLVEPGQLSFYLMLLKKIFTCKQVEDYDIESYKEINILLNSTLNVEIVFVMLEGIVNCSKVNLKNEDDQSQITEETQPDFTQVRINGNDVTLKIDRIKMDDLDEWEPTQAQIHVK